MERYRESLPKTVPGYLYGQRDNPEIKDLSRFYDGKHDADKFLEYMSIATQVDPVFISPANRDFIKSLEN